MYVCFRESVAPLILSVASEKKKPQKPLINIHAGFQADRLPYLMNIDAGFPCTLSNVHFTLAANESFSFCLIFILAVLSVEPG